VKLVTFNIRTDCGADGVNNWCFRKEFVLRKLMAEQPDVVCFQEVKPHVAEWLRENMTGYYVVGCGRNAQLACEQETVAFRADRYNLIEMETYWLSETPYVPGSRYEEQSEYPRVCTQVVLTERETNRSFRVVNVHLDHIGAGARRLGLKQILEHVDDARLFADAPAIVTGDFNTYPGGEEFDAFDAHPGYTDFTEGIGVTWHDYGRITDDGNIDFVFVRGALACDGVEKWTDTEGELYLSDHYPVCARLRWV